MRAPLQSSSAGGTGLATPAIVVILVLLLGASIYLWRAQYLRPRTAYATMAILVLLLVLFGALMHGSL